MYNIQGLSSWRSAIWERFRESKGKEGAVPELLAVSKDVVKSNLREPNLLCGEDRLVGINAPGQLVGDCVSQTFYHASVSCMRNRGTTFAQSHLDAGGLAELVGKTYFVQKKVTSVD